MPNPYDKDKMQSERSKFAERLRRKKEALERLRQQSKHKELRRLVEEAERRAEKRLADQRRLFEETERRLADSLQSIDAEAEQNTPPQSRWDVFDAEGATGAKIRAVGGSDSIAFDSTSTSRRALNEGNIFVTLCRAFSMISGGFLFGSGISHNSLLGSIIGTAAGVGVFVFNEVTVRRVEQ